MHLDHLKYLIELKNCSSINIASQKLFITPSTLSIAIKNLEKELGFKIIHRTHKGILLTDTGKHLVDAAKYFFLQIDSIIEENTKNSLLENVSEPIHFCAVQGALDSFLPQAICGFYRLYPQATLSVSAVAASKIIEIFEANTEHQFLL